MTVSATWICKCQKKKQLIKALTSFTKKKSEMIHTLYRKATYDYGKQSKIFHRAARKNRVR
jgi:hypothetical protein